MPVWVLGIYTLAAARLTGLITDDDITSTARMAVLNRLPANKFGAALAELITCQWCVSMWVSVLLAAPIAYWWGERPWLLVPALGLAMSQVTGMLSRLGRSRPDGD